MAVLPLDASSSRLPGNSPRARPSRRMKSAGLSLTLPPGFNHSHFSRTVSRSDSRTESIGVFPTSAHNSGSVKVFLSDRPAVRLSVAVKDLLPSRSEEHTSELQSRLHLVCRLLLEKKKQLQHNLV